jgi:hypothetical protein
VRKAIETATALFTWLSGRNGPDQQAAIAFKARDFRPGDGGSINLESVGLLDRDKVNAECPRLGEVQARTNAAAAAVDREGGNFTPAKYGTAVHTNLKRQIDDLRDPDFVAERSFLKGRENVRYGEKDSIRIDVLENVGNGTVCVYDIKTGERGLSMARTVEIYREVQANYMGVQRIIISEIRPRR